MKVRELIQSLDLMVNQDAEVIISRLPRVGETDRPMIHHVEEVELAGQIFIIRVRSR